MTGFARVRRSSEAGEVVISVKSVNHRGLDMHFHMSGELDVFEAALRAAIKRRAARGHFQIHVYLNRIRDGDSAAVNQPMLRAYLSAFHQAAAEQGLNGEPDLNIALSIPGMFREAPASEPGEELEHLVMTAMEEALESLNAFREREGTEIAAELRSRAGSVRDLAARIEEIRHRALPAFQARLSERLGELLEDAPIDPQRLAQEVAVLADRSDIGEELARLKIHAAQLEDLLDQGGEIGKKMDFLLQEMNRETNTILSKTSGVGELGLGITKLALAAKADIEKIREQALNLE
jgi:uncharacterized protein (TIGR00255 family)